MSNSTRNALIVALCFIGVGLILLFGAMSITGFDFTAIRDGSMDTTNSIIKTAEISDPFHSIRIDDVQCDVQILPSADGTCSVVYTDSDLFTHQIEVQNQTLTVTRKDIGSWMDRIFVIWTEESYVKVYVPAENLERLSITTVSGNILVPDGFSFREAHLSSTSGNIGFTSLVEDALTISTTSGDISLERLRQSELNLDTTSGCISLGDIQGKSLSVNTASGDIAMRQVVISGHTEISTASGDIELRDVDSQSADFNTASGDIEGTVLAPKNFDADTSSGEISLPPSDGSAGRWSFSTASGDIEVEVSP